MMGNMIYISVVAGWDIGYICNQAVKSSLMICPLDGKNIVSVQNTRKSLFHEFHITFHHQLAIVSITSYDLHYY